MKYCKDCKHMEQGLSDLKFATCLHPDLAAPETCLVSGATTMKHPFCFIERTMQYDNLPSTKCGSAGTLWEAK